jgi:hypothetical protein
LDRRITLKWTLDMSCGRLWTEFIWFRVGTVGQALVNMVMNLQVPKKAIS